MELDDLKQTWEARDRKLDLSIRLNSRLLQATLLGKAETALKRLSRLLWIELLLTVVPVMWLGSFAWEHAAEPRFLIPGGALLVGAIALVAACIRQIVAISEVDYGAPIVAIQRRLVSLHAERIRATKWTFLLAPLAWPLLFMVTMRALGVDAFVTFDAAWLAGNVLFGFLVIGLGVWISRRYSERMKRSTWLRGVLRDIAGQNLTAANGFLRSLSEFEREAEGQRP